MATKKRSAKKAAKEEKPVKKAAKVKPFDNCKQTPAHGNEKKKEKKKDEERPKVDRATTQTRTISHVKLHKEKHLTVVCDTIESDGATPHRPVDYVGRPVHEDLENAFNALRVHMGLITEDISVQHVKPIDEYPEAKINKFVVQGVHIKTSKKGIAYILTGYKKLSKDTLGVNTPKRLKEENEDTRYAYMDELVACIDVLLDEVAMYESGEKVGKVQQTAMDFGEKEEEGDNLEGAFAENGKGIEDVPYAEEAL